WSSDVCSSDLRQPLDAFERLPVAVHGETRRARDHRRRRAARCLEQFELALDVAATVPLQFVDEDAALLFGPRERGEVLIDGLNMADVLFLGLPGPALRREAVPPVRSEERRVGQERGSRW